MAKASKPMFGKSAPSKGTKGKPMSGKSGGWKSGKGHKAR